MIYRIVDASLLNLTGLEDLLGFANKSTNEYPHRRWKSSAFQAGF